MSLPERPERPFDAPWQASAFAMTVALSQSGCFSWPDWASAFGRRRSGAEPEGDYWEDWLATLEEMLERGGHIDAPSRAAIREAWAQAYATTPHGQPVRLQDP